MKGIIALLAIVLFLGCANQDFNQAAVPSDITEFYRYSAMFLSASTTTGLLFRADGTGWHCFYSNDKPTPNKTPIRHIGGNKWAAATFGTGEVVQNPDG